MRKFYSSHQSRGNVLSYELSPVDKIVELYERLLKTKRELLKAEQQKNEILENRRKKDLAKGTSAKKMP